MVLWGTQTKAWSWTDSVSHFKVFRQKENPSIPPSFLSSSCSSSSFPFPCSSPPLPASLSCSLFFFLPSSKIIWGACRIKAERKSGAPCSTRALPQVHRVTEKSQDGVSKHLDALHTLRNAATGLPWPLCTWNVTDPNREGSIKLYTRPPRLCMRKTNTKHLIHNFCIPDRWT